MMPIDSFHPIVLQKPPSADQAPAVATVDRDVVFVAGAGAGKTRTLVARILHLLATGTPARAVVAVTFTVKAAREMRNRLRQEIATYLATPTLEASERSRWQAIYADLDAARIGTIHGLCTEILRAHPAEAALDPSFAVLEEAVMLQARSEAIDEALTWATEEAAATALFAYFTADALRALLDTLLADRLKAAALFAARPWERWRALLADSLTAVLAAPDVATAAADILAIEATGGVAAALLKGDKLAPPLADFVDGWRTVQQSLAAGDVAHVVASLPRLRAGAPGNCGRAANWPGIDIKATTRAFRNAYDAQIKPLVDAVDPALDAALTALMPQIDQLFAVALAGYHRRKAERHALDFDDLEALALDLLQRNGDVRARWQEEAHALLVDEFQDTNHRQRDLVQMLNGGQGRLFIVGDAKQSIYRFRGAEVEVFRTERAAIEARGLRCDMHTSYRSHAALLAALNTLLDGVMGSDAADAPWREPFAPLTAARTDTTAQPAPFVEFHLAVGAKGDGSLARAADGLAMRLQQLAGADPSAAAPRWGDIAVLCRSSHAFTAYEDAFERAGIPYETVAGRGFLDRPEVRDLLNALQAVTDPTDDLALYGLLRSPAIGLADTTLHHLRMQDVEAPGSLWRTLCIQEEASSRAAVAIIRDFNELTGRVAVAELLKRLVDTTGYRAILLAAGDTRGARNVSKLLLDAQRSGLVSTGAFLEYVRGLHKAGTREGEARADSTGAVQIMTVHQAKGLEFPIVIIGDAASSAGNLRSPALLDRDLGVVVNLAAESGVPLVWNVAQQRELSKEAAESDRLLYVAATRAADRLLISGHIGDVKRDGSLSIAGWLGRLCTVAGLEQLPAGFDPDGAAPHLRFASLPGSDEPAPSLYVALYPTEFSGAVASAPGDDAAATEPSLPPRLLNPVTAPADRETAATPPRVWRVAPRQTQRRAPSWVVGKLVHAALAAWRFPPAAGFVAWCQAQARGHGLLDDARLDDAVRRTCWLLNNFQRHALHAQIAAAALRWHEVPYTLPEPQGDGVATSGQIDLLFRASGRWTLVDFKTDRLRDERARAQLLEVSDYRAQIARYVTAVATLLGERPRGLLCLLDDRGACSVVELDQAPARPAPVNDDHRWTQAQELADPACAALLAACRSRGLPAPALDHEILDAHGSIVATAHLAWPAAQVAVFLPGDDTEMTRAGEAGWRTVQAAEAAATPTVATQRLLAYLAAQ